MPTTHIPTLASRGTMLEEVDRLELGPDPAGAAHGVGGPGVLGTLLAGGTVVLVGMGAEEVP